MRRTAVVTSLVVVLMLSVVTLGPAQTTPPPKVPGLQLPEMAGQMFLATRDISPGVVLHVSAAGETPVFTRPANNLTSFSFGRMPRGVQADAGVMSLAFCNGISQKSIWKALSPTTEGMVSGDREYIREVAFGPAGGLYYSQAWGGARDGRIMALMGAAPILFTDIQLAKIDGFWAGNFAFDPFGNLYVSNGNMGGAKLWLYPRGGAPSPRVAFKASGSILGFWFLDRERFLYTDGSAKVYKAHVGGTGPDGVAYQSKKEHKFCDVLVR